MGDCLGVLFSLFQALEYSRVSNGERASEKKIPSFSSLARLSVRPHLSESLEQARPCNVVLVV